MVAPAARTWALRERTDGVVAVVEPVLSVQLRGWISDSFYFSTHTVT